MYEQESCRPNLKFTFYSGIFSCIGCCFHHVNHMVANSSFWWPRDVKCGVWRNLLGSYKLCNSSSVNNLHTSMIVAFLLFYHIWTCIPQFSDPSQDSEWARATWKRQCLLESMRWDQSVPLYLRTLNLSRKNVLHFLPLRRGVMMKRRKR